MLISSHDEWLSRRFELRKGCRLFTMFRCSGDDTFGPTLGSSSPNPSCYNFDFTLVFEDSIFSILPCGIVIILGAWRLFALAKRPVAIQWPLLRALKAVSFCAARSNCREGCRCASADICNSSLPLLFNSSSSSPWFRFKPLAMGWSPAQLLPGASYPWSRHLACSFSPILSTAVLLVLRR